ncbi:MAG: hypothetical protein ABI640_12945 [Gammaproteobacteria bacterium]
MTTAVVLATGPSMSSAVVEQVHAWHGAGGGQAIAVCNAYQLAPWADALVCNDRAWWRLHAEAMQFRGAKYCGAAYDGTQTLPARPRFPPGTNSGLQGCRVAEMLGATKVLLLGFDMHGTHYFGKHPQSLKNTSANGFKRHIWQFSLWNGPEIVNCTPGSALKRFRFSTLEQELAECPTSSQSRGSTTSFVECALSR